MGLVQIVMRTKSQKMFSLCQTCQNKIVNALQNETRNPIMLVVHFPKVFSIKKLRCHLLNHSNLLSKVSALWLKCKLSDLKIQLKCHNYKTVSSRRVAHSKLNTHWAGNYSLSLPYCICGQMRAVLWAQQALKLIVTNGLRGNDLPADPPLSLFINISIYSFIIRMYLTGYTCQYID